jgi:hypothetical protein
VSGAASAMAAPIWKIFFLTIPPLRSLLLNDYQILSRK